MSTFEDELRALINKHSLENDSDTPDFLLAKYMCKSLDLFNVITRHRDHYYGRSRKTEVQAPGEFDLVANKIELQHFGDINTALDRLSIRQTPGEFKETNAVRVAALGERSYSGTGKPRHPYDRPDSFWEEEDGGKRPDSAGAPYIEP